MELIAAESPDLGPNRGPDEPHSRFVSASGIRLRVLDYAGGDPSLFVVPGITSPAVTWDFVARRLAPEHRVLVLDLRGRGLSDKPAAGHTLPDYAADVASALIALGLRRPVVVGHSLGARIAAAASVLYPGTAGANVVVDPPVSGPGRAPYPFPVDFYLEQRRSVEEGATLEDMRRSAPSWTDEQLEARLRWLPTCDERAIVETHRNFHEEDFYGYWGRVPAPVLFMRGAESAVVPVEALDEIRAANPSAEVVEVPGAGHLVPWDNLDGFVAAVHGFATRSAGE